MQQLDAELEFEMLCREWDIPRGRPPVERAPEHVSHDIYLMPESPGAVPSRRGLREEGTGE